MRFIHKKEEWTDEICSQKKKNGLMSFVHKKEEQSDEVCSQKKKNGLMRFVHKKERIDEVSLYMDFNVDCL